MAAPTVPSIRIVKSFDFLQSTRLWSNRYCFTGGTPANSTQWTTLADAVVTAEKAVHPSATHPVTITQAVGYEAGSEIPVFSKTYTTTGTLSIGTAWAAPGDAALFVRYATGVKTEKNHPLYLFSWYHGIFLNGASTADVPLSAQVVAHGTYAAAWIAGFSDGTHTLKRSGPKGDTATGYFVHQLIRHRDFPAA